MRDPAQPLPEGDADPVLDPIGPPLRRPAAPPILGPLPSSSRSSGAGGEPAAETASRYRRPERPAPSQSDPRGAPDPFVDSTDSALAAPASPGARAIAEPLAALAMAFQANAEALRRSQEMQADLGRALQRADRSEVLLQSTGALNDTFRGLSTVQKGLIQRIDASEKSAKEGRWFLPILVLASMAVIGALGWLLVRRMGEVEQSSALRGDIATQLAAQRDRGEEAGRNAAAAAFDVERTALRDRAERVETELRAALADRDEKASAAKAAQTELAGLQSEVVNGRNEALRARALESEVTRLRAEAAVRDPDVERFKRELAEERATTASLRKKLADLATGRSTGAELTDPTAGAADAGPAAPAAPVRVDRRDIEQARRIMNGLLQESSAGRPDYLQIGSIGGVEGERVLDVVATTYSSNGRVLSFVKARQMRVVADRVNRRVELVFDDGSIELNGQAVPFSGGVLRKLVAEADQVGRWTSSGLVFVSNR